MAIVSVAIVMSFHVKSQPSEFGMSRGLNEISSTFSPAVDHGHNPPQLTVLAERRIALPFGIVFWLLSLACLASGMANYIHTVTRYSTRRALVQSGWKTQTVCALSSPK